MAVIRLRFKEPRSRGYEVLVSPGLLSACGRLLKTRFPGRRPFLISSPRVFRLWGAPLVKSLKKASLPLLGRHLVPDGEKHKDLHEYQRGLKALASAAAGAAGGARPFVILLGGGVVGDLGGFVAATYRRGIPFAQVPTTLLAMVDSSVGGKLGVDFNTPRGRIKNLVGTFAQPSLVLADPLTLATLPPRQLRSGLAEVIKTALLFDAPLLRLLEKTAASLGPGTPPAFWQKVITACVKHKARMVEKDEYDARGERALLNLGHTFGHAVEAASGFSLTHGEGVAFGLVCAADLAARLGRGAPATLTARLEEMLKKTGLPARLKGLSLNRMLKAMSEDKKFGSGMRFVLPEGTGRCRLREVKDARAVKSVLKERLL